MRAWRQLADRYDPQRAAWIARLLRPRISSPRTAPTEPSFPRVDVVEEGKDAAWRSAPKARLLPSRWIAIVQGGWTRHCRGRRPRHPAGPRCRSGSAGRCGYHARDPRRPGRGRCGHALDGGFRRGGSGRHGAAHRAHRRESRREHRKLDRARGEHGRTANEGAKQLGEQLDAQHYTDGLEFLRFGTPSNNTSAERSGYGAEDAGHERSFATESGAVDVTLDEQSNGQRLGTALGLPGADIAPVLASVAGGSDRHEVDQRSMSTALWQATWGYFLTNMIGMEGTGLTPETLAWARDHFIAHVRSGGPFPPLRCGRQPYGVCRSRRSTSGVHVPARKPRTRLTCGSEPS